MTMRYAHLTAEHLQSSVKFMDMTSESDASIPFLDQREVNVMDNLRMLGS